MIGKVNRPSLSVVAVYALPCVRLVRVTVAPGSTPDWESLTDPDTEALVVCACTGAGPTRQRTPTRAAPSTVRRLRNVRTKGIYILSSASGDADSRGTRSPERNLLRSSRRFATPFQFSAVLL